MKFAVFILLFIIICCMAGIYGFLHDQISYTVSPEYFTCLKFQQFNIPDSLHNRIGAGVVGILATWWMGIVIGIVIIPIGLIIPTWKKYFSVMVQAFVCVCVTALLTGITGLLYGLINFSATNLPNFFIPNDVKDIVNFCVIGNMHNFSYIGGIIGMITGIVFIIVKKFLPRSSQRNTEF